MAEQFFEEEIKTYLECNNIKANDKQVKSAVELCMCDDSLWDNINLGIYENMKKAKIKLY